MTAGLSRKIKPAICFVLCFLANAFDSFAADKWIGVRTRNFLLVGNASENQIRDVGRDLEEFRAALSLLFPRVGEPSSVGTTVIVFKSDDSFKPYKPVFQG